jgi:hypothetical protein
MKRFLQFLMLMLAILLMPATAMAKPPKLASEEFFNGSYDNMRNVSVSINRTRGSYVRCFSVTDNDQLVKKVTRAVLKDLQRAQDYSELKEGGERYIVMTILCNGYPVQIGLQVSRDDAYLFISGSSASFK